RRRCGASRRTCPTPVGTQTRRARRRARRNGASGRTAPQSASQRGTVVGAFFDGLIAWSIHNRVVVLLGAAALTIGGIYAALHAPLDVLPDFTPPRVVVQTEAPAMGTLDVEQLVTRPIEHVVLGTPQASSVRSTSAAGLSVITLTFEDAVDVYRARQVVTERLQLVQGHLPDGVPPPQLAPILAPISAILKVFLTSTNPDAAQAARE